jgi:hypothetical protein
MDFSDMEKMKHSRNPNTCALWLALTALEEIADELPGREPGSHARKTVDQITRYLDQHRQAFEA